MSALRPILVAEDNPDDAELTLAALRGLNLRNEITVVNDGADVIDFLHRRNSFAMRPAGQHPAVVLLDLKLPRMDGFETLRQIHADPELGTVPIVILTSSREETDLIADYSLGANGYVVKPVDFEQFVATVGRIGAFWALVNEPPPRPRNT